MRIRTAASPSPVAGPPHPATPRCVLPPLDPRSPSPFDQRRVTLARTLARDRAGQSDETLALPLHSRRWSMDRGSSAEGCCACYHGPETVDWPRGCSFRRIRRDRRDFSCFLYFARVSAPSNVNLLARLGLGFRCFWIVWGLHRSLIENGDSCEVTNE